MLAAIGNVVHEMTPEQARGVWKALMEASYAAEQWGKELAGYNRLRVRLVSAGVVEATYHGETRRLRLCAPRKHHRTCRACNERCTLFWCDQKGPGYFVEVCDPCVQKLAAEPAALRPIG